MNNRFYRILMRIMTVLGIAFFILLAVLIELKF